MYVNLMKQNVIQINGGIMINLDVSVKKIMYVKKIIFGILEKYICENGKYLAGIMDDSMIICDEVVKSCDEKINFNKKKVT